MSLDLRDYQLRAVQSSREGLAAGHRRQVLCAPTGSGKTVIASHLMTEAAGKMTNAVFIVDRVALVDQTSRMFDSYSIAHGVIQANHYRWRPWEHIQIATAQTLARRGAPAGIRLAIVDECHTMYKPVTDFLERNPAIIALGLTATPFAKGMGKLYSHVINVTTTDALIEEGHLARIKAYAAKRIDMTGAKLKFNGEWDDAEVEAKALVIVGDVVQGWIEKTQQHFGGPVKTIVFSATVAHGEELCRQFQAAGFNFQQISYKDGNDERRRRLIEEFRKPDCEIMGLVSCEALAKGFDVPDIRCGISCRPYRKSLSGHIQQLGRVMRPAPGKEFALWLDHAGNYLRFAADTARVFAEGVSDLNECDLDARARPEPKDRDSDNACKGCGYILAKADTCCPSCGKERPRRLNTISHKPGELAEVSLLGRSAYRHKWMEDKEGVYAQLCGYALTKYDGDHAKAKRLSLAKFQEIYKEWPSRTYEATVPRQPSPELSGYLRHLLIAFMKGRDKRAGVAA